MAAPGNRIFVSSTCYDLLDLRAEVEAFLRELGLDPLMSDRPASEFEVTGRGDSIATCLHNVEKCDAFVCILSQRYGTKLGKVGFEDISATHLEYRKARELKLPMYFYVRDRLRGEYDIWKKSPNAVFRWLGSKEDLSLFDFMREHERLAAGAEISNWMWPFRDSVELCTRLRQDLGAISRAAIMRGLIASDHVPFLAIAPYLVGGGASGNLTIDCRVENLSASEPALDLHELRGDEWKPVAGCVDLKATAVVNVGFTAFAPVEGAQKHTFQRPSFRYVTRRGHVIRDDFAADVTFDDAGAAHRARFRLVRRTLERDNGIQIG
jgi:hypothetical protein